ncbi:hypothetical protein FSP39_004569 [Pinctada imbricata]|uniref:Neuroguidin n=1 Tax=Pinctada imbricata TaxID=66713 RepID=A0AA88XHL4_PINIB|nr:hypothetical protein FSP39_004569 [Pinctada imbricata]
MLSYLIDLTHLMLHKCHGKSIEGNPSVWRLVELRTVLEKMKPIDQKLKYQIDKVIKIANTGSTESSDPLRYRANPDNFASKLESEDDDSEGEEGGEDKETKIYRPPHIAAVAYDGDEKEKEVRAIEKAKKRALSSSIMRELKEEYSEGPQEIKVRVKSRIKSKEEHSLPTPPP